MFETKYKYNPKTLTYERVEISVKKRVLTGFSFVATGLVFAAIFILFFYVGSHNEKKLLRENEQLVFQYNLLNKRVDQLTAVLDDIQKRDDDIYRTIFEAEPIAKNIRKAGIGGVNRHKNLEGYDNSDIVITSTKKLDQLAKQLYVQSTSFDEVFELAKEKEKMLASIPAIQPISNKDLARMASGYGYRIHPIYKTRKMHSGMDFTAPTGTEIYATGNGIIKEVERSRRGFGNHVVIDHGFGYQTIYAHMSTFNVRVGQKIKRGEIIGYVGNTGTSTAPHLHYEVHKNGQAVNPISFYFNDLTPKEYDAMIELSAAANQSFD